MRKPRRHPLFLDDLGNGSGLGGYFFIGNQCEGGFRPGTMALDAMFVDDRRNVLRVVQRSLRRWCSGKSDYTTVHRGLAYTHFAAGQHVVNGLFEVLPISGGLDSTQPVLIVDPAAIAELSSAIQHDDFRRAAGSQGAGALPPEVLCEREFNFLFDRLVSDLFQ